MFYLYQSNRLESLAALFCRIQKINPLSDPWAEEEVVVQSQGMRRYLSACLARETGVAANLKFSLPAGLTWRLMRRVLLDIPENSPFAPEVMRWRLVDLFRSDGFQTASEFALSRAALQSYLAGSESADYQLGGLLADIFDQYLVYRPQWIEAWRQGKLLDLGGDEGWQAELWRYLDDGSQSALHRVALWAQLLQRLEQRHLPERLFVFGISTMAPMYLQLLQKIAEHCDVFMFALNPSAQYWGNVIEPAQILQGGDEADLTQSGHPLLASLGKQGRDFFDFLSEIEMETPVFESDDVEGAPGLLHRLQQDIQNLRMPSENREDNVGSLHDGSIQIVSAHSPLRELQILRDKLLKMLADHPDWQPHDIAVLTPDISPYTPFIEAVFGKAAGGGQPLPYSVSDVKISRNQPLLTALAQLLACLEGRFEVDQVLALLDNRLVRERFELSQDDMPLLKDTAAQLNIHWGWDGSMRGGGDNLFTWQQALERLVSGWLMPEGAAMWHNISAWHADINRLAVFARFTAFVRTLAEIYQAWQQPADTAVWVQRIRDTSAALFAPDKADQAALQQFEQALAAWQQDTDTAGFNGDLPLHTVIRHISRFLNSESQAGFLRGGITFCSMVPMRSLPFKVICLLGLNDGSFPRNTRAAEFDLIARHPQKGDRARRDDDRYLFLEALISARDVLYLSYVGRNIRTDEALAPSPLLNELVDTVAAMTGVSGKNLLENWIEQHPLQAFSHRYFAARPSENGVSAFISTRSDYAQALAQAPETAQPFWVEALNEAEPETIIAQHRLTAFWRNPLKYWLQHNLAWREPYFDETLAAGEPFEPEHTEKIMDAYLEARRNRQDFAETAARLQAESLLPSGELGKLWQQDFQTLAKQIDGELLDSRLLPPQTYELTIGGATLHGSLSHLHQAGRIIFKNRNLSYPDKVAALLEHLLFCAVRPSETDSCRTYWVIGGETQILNDIPQQQASAFLESWVQYFQIGQQRPLPFFARLSWQTAEKYCKSESDWDTARQEAWTLYHGKKNQTAQKSYTEAALVFGNDEQEPVETPLFRHLIEDMLAPAMAAAFGEEKAAE
ncbi:exodeoxyribonuclease V subunit gamma [Neisseria sp. ZJ106]|uniref:RecBCD enzyme subunit RecC n=1 Tax=Neisseria lisongii TaxID=2912188 RepID=A0ABY7RKA1_9NEIS|nr:exodeoxyribonuclease V subunit gamma [Neisseria lisongii]MCF7521246.1 exodeoxyribonuclease V subunit gamma [Neisseria lisongii]WCL71738.1 exodeoxyribonuclease V subunit gamma [Neisseria lisongii]